MLARLADGEDARPEGCAHAGRAALVEFCCLPDGANGPRTPIGLQHRIVWRGADATALDRRGGIEPANTIR